MADASSIRRRRGRRTVLGAVTGWVGVVVVVSVLTWFAIGSAGNEVLAPQSQAVPTTAQPDVDAPGSSPTPGAPSSTGSPLATTAAPTGPVPVDQVHRVTGGQVGWGCRGEEISLNGAWPDDGWTVKSSISDGGARLRVEFQSDEARTRVEAGCVNGGPSVSVEDDAGDRDGSGDDD